MKLTRHNGRSGKNGTYNPKHNDRRFEIGNSDHIDELRARRNVYWDCYQGLHFPEDQEQEDKIVYSFEEVEKTFYFDRYYDFCEAQHERNRKTGHSGRDRSTEDLRLDKKTCPEESLIQIGTVEASVPPLTLARIAVDFFAEFENRYGEHVHILDWSLHLDEATPHIHERHVFDCENRYGEIAPQQEKALEALGFDLPNPGQKPGKSNNRKMQFDAACRKLLFDITKKHGLHLEQQAEFGGREYLEKQDYILMKQKERLAVQEKQIELKESRLETLTIRIENTESFIEQIAETAYEKAVEAVTDTVKEEIRNQDFDFIVDQRESVLNDDRYTWKEKQFAGNIFHNIMNRFRNMTRYISTRLSRLFNNPETKENIKEPIRESLRSQLAWARREADAWNTEHARQRKRGRDMRDHERIL